MHTVLVSFFELPVAVWIFCVLKKLVISWGPLTRLKPLNGIEIPLFIFNLNYVSL